MGGNSSVFPVYIKAEYAGSGPAFAQLTADAKKSVTDVQRAFEQGYGQVSQIVQKALSQSRNKGGSLDLGVDDYRAAAKEADAYAIATREVANAMRYQAVSAGKLSKEDQAVAAAARMAAKEAEKHALELNALAKSAELTQQALNRQKSATDAVVAATGRGTTANQMMVNSTRAARTAQIQMGQQLQDVAISLYSGQRASVVLAQQLPQLAFAFTGTEGKIGKFATALSSGFGSIALVAGAAGLGLLIEKLIGTGEEADKAGSATSRLTDKLDLTKNSYQSLIAVVDEYNKAQDTSTAKTYEAIIAAGKETEALLKKAEAQLLASKSIPRYAGQELGGRQTIDATSNALEARIKELRGKLADSDIAKAAEERKLASDERYALERGFIKQINDLEEKRRLGLIDKNKLSSEGLRIDKERIAALKAYDESQRKTTSSTSTSTENNVGNMKALLKQLFGEGTYIGDNAKHSKYTSSGNISDHWGPNARALDFVPEGGMSKYSSAQVEEMLRNAGVNIRRGLGGNEQFFGPGRSANKKGDHDDHFHVAWEGAVNATKAIDKMEDALAKAREGTDRFADSAAQSIAGVSARWDDQPKLVNQANASIREMDRLLGNIEDRLVNDASLTDEQRGLLGGLIPQIEKAKTSISTFVDRDIAKWVDQSQQGMEIQKLLLSGYDDQAAVQAEINKRLEWAGKLTEDQIATITAQVLAEQELTREIERRQELQGSYLNTIRTLRGEVESMFSGRGFDVKRLQQSFLDLQGKIITDRLFGKAFSDLETWAKKETGFDGAVIKLETQTSRASDAISALADAANSGAARLSGGDGATSSDALLSSFDATFAGSGAAKWDAITAKWDAEFGRSIGGFANDNDFAAAQRKAMKNSALGLNPPEFFMQMKKSIALGLESSLGPISGPVSGFLAGSVVGGKAGGALGLLSSLGLGKVSGFAGRALGGLSKGAMIGSALGLDARGSAIGGIAGDLLGIGGIGGGLIGGLLGGDNLKGKLVGAGLGAAALTGYVALASGAGIGGSAMAATALGVPVIALGAIVGALLAGIFKKAKTGSASVSNGAVSLGGNNAERRDKLNSATGGISDAIANIADQLGGTVGNYGYTIGIRKDEYRVSGSAGANVTSKNPGGLLYKGKDGEEAARIALLNAIQDGAIAGIRAGAQRLLASGKDLERQVQKALSLQSIFDRLQAHDDPMGYALGKLDREFANLRSIATEAGEGAVEVERLYGLERARVIEETNKQVTASLRDLYDGLTAGSDARSLGERRAYALAKYDPLASRVAAGDKAAYDDFAAAAQALLDIERQMYGSQGGYFSRLDEITNLTKTRIDAESNVASIAASGGSSASNDNVPVVNAIDSQTAAIIALGNQGNALASETNALLSQLLSRGFGGGGNALLNYQQLF